MTDFSFQTDFSVGIQKRKVRGKKGRQAKQNRCWIGAGKRNHEQSNTRGEGARGWCLALRPGSTQVRCVSLCMCVCVYMCMSGCVSVSQPPSVCVSLCLCLCLCCLSLPLFFCLLLFFFFLFVCFFCFFPCCRPLQTRDIASLSHVAEEKVERILDSLCATAPSKSTAVM